MKRMLYGPFAAFDASRVGVALVAGVAALANRLTPSDAARTPAPMVFRASLRPMLISDSSGIAIINLRPLCALQTKLTLDAAARIALQSVRNPRLAGPARYKYKAETNERRSAEEPLAAECAPNANVLGLFQYSERPLSMGPNITTSSRPAIPMLRRSIRR